MTKKFCLPICSGDTINVIVGEALGSTMSCVMSVRLGNSEGPVSVLNLYDRRGSQSLRKSEHASTWSPEIEEEYIKFVESGGAAEY
jgi:hypothetical protein